MDYILKRTSHIFETEMILSHDDELDDHKLEDLLQLVSTYHHIGGYSVDVGRWMFL